MNTCTSDRCQQGRANCPTPQACEMPIQYAHDEPTSGAIALWVVVCVAVLGLVSFIATFN